MTKKELRTQYLAKRKALSAIQRRRLSEELCANFFKDVDLTNVHILHCYLSIERHHEPDTSLIVAMLQSEYPGIHIAVPRVVSRSGIESIFLEPGTKLKKNKLGIPEPVGGKIVTPTDIDLIIVPLLCFEAYGYRVGYGAGYYDRFLQQCHGHCERVGLSFFDAVTAIDDANKTDIPLTRAITPHKTFVF